VKAKATDAVLAFAWGLAEATVFFIVPDVLLTRLALRDFRRSFLAALWAVAGALVGGVLLWMAARHGAADAWLAFFDRLPGISPEMIRSTGDAIRERGLPALATGALAGQPYKLYAVHAGTLGIPLLPFLVASFAARLGRFLLTSAIVWAIGRALHRQSETLRLRLHLVAWGAFYVFYFSVMRG
jgi:membrane protein YqaA with SNARE-associated domain